MRDPSLPRRRFEVDWALVVTLGLVLLGLAWGRAITGCARRDDPAHADSGAAPSAPARGEDDCPGGVCHIPPPKPNR